MWCSTSKTETVIGAGVVRNDGECFTSAEADALGLAILDTARQRIMHGPT